MSLYGYMGGTKHVSRKIRGKEATYETRTYKGVRYQHEFVERVQL